MFSSLADTGCKLIAWFQDYKHHWPFWTLVGCTSAAMAKLEDRSREPISLRSVSEYSVVSKLGTSFISSRTVCSPSPARRSIQAGMRNVYQTGAKGRTVHVCRVARPNLRCFCGDHDRSTTRWIGLRSLKIGCSPSFQLARESVRPGASAQLLPGTFFCFRD